MGRVRVIGMQAAVLVASCLLFAGRSEALHNNSPLITQVTHKPSQTIGSARFAMKTNGIVFHSDADLMANGNTVTQIFFFDTAKRILMRQRAFTQLTFGDEGSYNPSATARARVLAFDSAGDHLGNGSVGRQVFTANKIKINRPQAIVLAQVTKGIGESFLPQLSTSGRYLVFSSTGDLNAQGLAPGEHLYRADLNRFRESACGSYPCLAGANPGLDLVTPVVATGASVQPSGKAVVFESLGDAAGNGCVNGARQLFLRDFESGTVRQLTFGTADSRNARYSRDGKFIYFESAADLAATGSTHTQIFRYDLSAVPPRLKQITFGTDGDSADPAPGPGGSVRLFFTSTADLTNRGVAGVRSLYVYELQQNTLVRLSDAQQLGPGIDGNFNFATFVSDSDWLGNGNDEKQLFFLNSYRISGVPGTPTPAPTPVPTPVVGWPTHVTLALVAGLSEDNGDGTLTTVVSARVSDFQNDPVADGTFVDLSIAAPATGAAITDGRLNGGPTAACNLSQFQLRTGVPINSQPGYAYVCLRYPREQANTNRHIGASVGPHCNGGVNDAALCSIPSECPGGSCTQGSASTAGTFVLPPPVQECSSNGVPCNDFDPCTLTDVCGGGTSTCIGGAKAGLPCATSEQCVTPTGGYCRLPTCVPGTLTTCADDGNLCTDDVCNSFTGTCYTAKQCLGDDNACTDDVCDPSTGTCGVPNSDACSDDDPCTVGDVCAAGACAPGPTTTCPDDGNPCTNDVCNPRTASCGIPQTCVCA